MTWSSRNAVGVLLVGVAPGLSAWQLCAGQPGAAEAPVLVRGSDGVRLPPATAAKLGLGTAEVKPRAAAVPRVLRLPGSLAIDPARLVRIRARFAPAVVVEIGSPAEPTGRTRPGKAAPREPRAGDRVKEGDVLAVLISTDVAARKKELYDALIQLRLDEEILAKAEKAADSVPEIFILNARRTVEADRGAVARAEKTLKVWGIPEKEIAAVRRQAREAGERKGKPEAAEARKAREDLWGRVTLRAPFDGVIVERNVALHEVVADSTVNLFQIADLKRLLVLANASEGELPDLNALPAGDRWWTVHPGGDGTGIKGPIEEVGYLIDPGQHTAVLKGRVDNSDGLLRAGQYVTASVALPTTAEAVLPAAALVEEGGKTFVFVQPDVKKPFFEQRRVLVLRRGGELAHVCARVRPEQERQGYQTVRPGERVITSAVLELKAILDDLKSAAEP
jgi:cobalt-zinc-cadmium efflux system membrane fusion protein